MGNSDRVKSAALWVMVVLSIVSSWYPFALDLPKRVVNSAVQRPDGAWDVDANSRIISHVPEGVAAMLSGKRLTMTVEATSRFADQEGPARLVSIGRSPYDPALMIGIDHRNVVLYLPCDGAAPDLDVDWQIPFNGEHALAIKLWIDRSDATTVVSMQVNDQKRVQLDNHCPPGASPGLPKATVPWALGNVANGHRPFVGRIDKLVMTGDGHSVDLLRAVPWDAPSEFWMLPERLYERSNNVSDEFFPALWHFASFALLAGIAAAHGDRRAAARRFAAVLMFAIALTAGKLLVATRHVSVIDLMVNLAGAATGLYAYNRSASMRYRS